MLNQRQDDFQQRVIAAVYPHDPTLEAVNRLFPQEEDHVDADAIFYPTNAEEFERMMQMWE